MGFASVYHHREDPCPSAENEDENEVSDAWLADSVPCYTLQVPQCLLRLVPLVHQLGHSRPGWVSLELSCCHKHCFLACVSSGIHTASMLLS